jgi:hypothetical protein
MPRLGSRIEPCHARCMTTGDPTSTTPRHHEPDGRVTHRTIPPAVVVPPPLPPSGCGGVPQEPGTREAGAAEGVAGNRCENGTVPEPLRSRTVALPRLHRPVPRVSTRGAGRAGRAGAARAIPTAVDGPGRADARARRATTGAHARSRRARKLPSPRRATPPSPSPALMSRMGW